MLLISISLKNLRTVLDMVSLIFPKWDVAINKGKNWSILSRKYQVFQKILGTLDSNMTGGFRDKVTRKHLQTWSSYLIITLKVQNKTKFTVRINI